VSIFKNFVETSETKFILIQTSLKTLIRNPMMKEKHLSNKPHVWPCIDVKH